MDVGVKNRLVAAGFAVGVTIYAGLITTMFFRDTCDRTYLMSGATLFMTAFFMATIYLMIKKPVKKASTKKSKRRSDIKDGRSRKKN